MGAIDSQLRILEIGEFSLFKKCVPQQTTLVFTGANPNRLEGVAFREFSPRMLPALLRSLRRGDWDIVFCYPPTMPLLDCRRGPLGILSTLVRVTSRFRTLGTYIARHTKSPLVVLDYNDMSSVSIPGLTLLEKSIVYFKRELPLDPAKALFNVLPRFRTHRRVMSSKYYAKNRDKFMPISAGVPQETVQMTLSIESQKTVDVFFAGSFANSEIRRKGIEQLKALAEKGYVVDICAGGLSKDEYLARCARSWLTWSPEGYGWECFRHYEASLCLSVPVLSFPSITRYAPLLNQIHAYHYSIESDDLLNTIEKALAQKSVLATVARNARQHVILNHTHDRICEYIIASAIAAVARLTPAPERRFDRHPNRSTARDE
jgi:hypothetical protein